MGFLERIKAALSPSKLTAEARVAQSKPLWDQFRRIGGGLTPVEVSGILQMADAGQPERLIDLGNESRQKDGHLQSTLATREQAVALVDLDFVAPDDANDKEIEAVDLCKRIVGDFKNWPTLIEHLAGSFFPGHATAEVRWEKTNGFLLPNTAHPIHPREFIFAIQDGSLRYRRGPGDTVGVDLLADNPGRIIQVQRRIVGDVQAREGLIRVLVWAALFRNWTLADWIALGEIGWKPWRIAKYSKGAHQSDVDKLVAALERIGSDGLAALPDTTDLKIEWPKGGTSQGTTSTHRELFDTVGREISKATLGQTTSTEAGPNGDRAGVEARDRLRQDLREADCRAIAASLRWHLFIPAVTLNLGPSVRCPVPWFQTGEQVDRVAFSEAIKNLQEAGLRIPAKWVRDEIGMPEPEDGAEVLEKQAPPMVPGGSEDDEDDDLDIPVTVEDEDDAGKAEPQIVTKGTTLDDGDGSNGPEYVDRVEESIRTHGSRELTETIAGVLSAVQGANGYAEARQALVAKYRDLAPPTQLASLIEAAITLSQAAGHLGVLEEAPEISGTPDDEPES